MSNIKNFKDYLLFEKIIIKILENPFNNIKNYFLNSDNLKIDTFKSNLLKALNMVIGEVNTNYDDLKLQNQFIIGDITTLFNEIKESYLEKIKNLNDNNYKNSITNFFSLLIETIDNNKNIDFDEIDSLFDKLKKLIEDINIKKVENNYTNQDLKKFIQNKSLVFIKGREYDNNQKDIEKGIIKELNSDGTITIIINNKNVLRNVSDIIKTEDLSSINDKIKSELSQLKDNAILMNNLLSFIQFLKQNNGNVNFDRIKNQLNNEVG